MKSSTPLACALAAVAMIAPSPAGQPVGPIIVRSTPLHEGRIDPKLFGNFIELLDDVVPGMWAEMLNDRSFEGVLRPANWCYYDGSLNQCDREWDPNASWTYETNNVFNGTRSAKITAAQSNAGSLTQSGLTVKKGTQYLLSGYFRADNPNLKISARLKTRLPDDQWLPLASAEFGPVSSQWARQAIRLGSVGGTDRAVFELHVEGKGALWADKLSLMPTDNLSGWREDVIAATREVRPGIVRWGGSVVDPGEYKWKDGIGDRDHRVPFRNKNWGRIDPNDVGIDEFCQFCELTGVEPLICVSFADGPQSAGELVEYCNGGTDSSWGARRAANGHSAPYRVKYWQVGNEISGEDTKYLDTIADFARFMKKADPGVQILSSYPSRQLLNRAGRDLAYIAPHHYTPDFERCDRQFGELSRLINDTPGCGHLKIAVTEWNIDGGGWGLGRGKQMTLAAALLNGRYLHVLMRHSDKVEIACRSNMANSFCGAIYETGPGGSGILKRPSYYLMKLYAEHARPIPLALDTAREAPDLFACASADKKSVTVFAINSEAKPASVSFQLTGFPGEMRLSRITSVCDVLNAGQPDIMNHWSTSERVKAIELHPADGLATLPPLSATALEFN